MRDITSGKFIFKEMTVFQSTRNSTHNFDLFYTSLIFLSYEEIPFLRYIYFLQILSR